MGNSLQDQLLKAGLVNKNQVQKSKAEKRKKTKQQRKSKQATVDANRKQAQQALQQKVQRDQLLNREKQKQAEQKAIAAQVRQLVQDNKLDRAEAQITFHFEDRGKIMQVMVTEMIQRQLTLGQSAIVHVANGYEVVPKVTADKIRQRDAALVIEQQNKPVEPEDDRYAEYKIPDDLMW